MYLDTNLRGLYFSRMMSFGVEPGRCRRVETVASPAKVKVETKKENVKVEPNNVRKIGKGSC